MSDADECEVEIVRMFRGYGIEPKPERLAFYARMLGNVRAVSLRRAIEAVCAEHEAQTPPAVGKIVAALARMGESSRMETDSVNRGAVLANLLDDYHEAIRGTEQSASGYWFTNFPHRIAWLRGQSRRGGLRGDIATAMAERLVAEWNAKRMRMTQ